MSFRPSAQGAATAGAEVGLLALAVGTAAGFTRLFTGWEFLRSLLPFLVLAWASAAALRRLGARTVAAMGVHLALGVVLLTVRFAPGTHVLGLPTSRTVRSLDASIEASFSEFSELVAPVQVTDGFLVVVAAALWLFALFADTAALRYRGVVQAAVPYAAVFLAVGVLAREHGRTSAAIWFAAGLAVYAVAQLHRSALGRRWVDGQAGRGAGSVTARAGLLGVAALVVGALVAPLLPGSTEPVVDLREIGRGDGPRTVVSPFVGLRSLLGPRSDQVLFTVDADEPAYWRLTALEQFDPERDIWVSSGTYSSAGGQLPRTASTEVPGRTLEQRVRVSGLSGLWLPGAYVPQEIRATADLSFDERSASIILRDGEDQQGVTYTLRSEVPDFAPFLGTVLPGRADPSIDPVHLDSPPPTEAVLGALEEVTAGIADDYGRMRALQDWFRTSFAYDEEVDYSGAGDALEAFLDERRGFCQQFSSAFALLARAAGLPSRIAVGFTPGDAEEVEGGGGTRFVVRGRHAHAWPEVHFAGIGWVPFEPTPQRGNPQFEQHTGVAPAQAEAPEESSTTTTAAPGAAEEVPPAEAPSTTSPAGDGRVDGTGDGRSGTDDPGGRPAWLLPAAIASVVVVSALALTGRRRRRPGMPRREGERAAIGSSWAAAVRSLSPLGLEPAASETPAEFAARVAAQLRGELLAAAGPGDTDGSTSTDRSAPTEGSADDTAAQVEALVGAIEQLAVIETRARYRRGAPGTDELEAASAAARRVQDYSSSLRRNRSRARVPALLK